MLKHNQRPLVFLFLLLVVGVLGLPFSGLSPAQAQQHIQFRNTQTGERIHRTYPEGAEVVFPITTGPSTGWPHEKAVVFNPRDTARVVVFDREPVARKQAQPVGTPGLPARVRVGEDAGSD